MGTRGTGVNLAPGYYDMATDSGFPEFTISRGFACVRGVANFTILEAKIDESNPVFPRVVSFAVRVTFLCDGIGPAGLTGIFSYNSTAPDIYIGPLLLSTAPELPDWPVNEHTVTRLSMLGGVPPYEFQTISSSLPPEISLSADGVLAGTPTKAGNYWFDVAVTDAVKNSVSNSHRAFFRLSLNVVNPPPPPPLGIAMEAVANANRGQPYSLQLAVTGGKAPFAWSLAGGHLPDGLTLGSNGQITGVAKAAGVFHFTAQVQDSFSQQARQDYELKVIEPPTIDHVSYKAKKGKLSITGEGFQSAAKLLIDDQEIKPKSQDSTGISVKKLFLSPGAHHVKIVNPDGGSASTTLPLD